MTQLYRFVGGGIVLLAVFLFAAIVLHPMYLGGDVYGGKVENGRYYVVGKGHRYTEVTATQWWIEQRLEASMPWLPVMLLWLGMAMRVGPGNDDQAAQVKKPSSMEAMQTLLLATLIVVGTGTMALCRCIQCGVPWMLGLGLWLGLWIAFFLATWLHSASTTQPPATQANTPAWPGGVEQ